MKKWLPYVVFSGVYLFSLIALMPASFIVNQLSLPKNISIGQIEGTVWNSQIAQVSVNNIVINRVNVDVSPLSIFLLNPSAVVTFGDALMPGPEGKFEISHLMSEIKISQLEMLVSANEVAKHLPLPIPVVAKNSVALAVEEFQFGQPVCQTMRGQVQWSKAGFKAMDETVELGGLSAILSCDKGELMAKLDDNNQLGVTFTATLGAKNQLKGQGFLMPSDNLPPAISQILPFLGQPDRQGRYRLAF
ncbi:type II secretion system protein N [Thalassotalea ganghwensis]